MKLCLHSSLAVVATMIFITCSLAHLSDDRVVTGARGDRAAYARAQLTVDGGGRKENSAAAADDAG